MAHTKRVCTDVTHSHDENTTRPTADGHARAAAQHTHTAPLALQRARAGVHGAGCPAHTPAHEHATPPRSTCRIHTHITLLREGGHALSAQLPAVPPMRAPGSLALPFPFATHPPHTLRPFPVDLLPSGSRLASRHALLLASCRCTLSIWHCVCVSEGPCRSEYASAGKPSGDDE